MALRAAGLAGAALLGSYLGVRTRRTEPLDVAVGRRCTRTASPALDRLVAAGTDLGSVHGLSGVTTALALSGRRHLAVEVATGGAIAWTGAQAAKPLLRRERPFELDAAQRLVATPAGSSWPSGHAAVAAAMATALGPRVPPRWRAALAGAVVGVAGSRLYVGVHHLSDVVAGIGLGVLAGRLARRLRSGAPCAAGSPGHAALRALRRR